MRGPILVLACGLVAGCPAEADGTGETTSTTTPATTHDTSVGATTSSADDTTTGASAFACDDSFAAVTGLFAARCATADCHDASEPAASLSLVGDWPAEVVGQPSNLCTDRTLVVPGDPTVSELWLKIAGPVDCGDPMPVGGAMLSAAELDCVAAWIEAAVIECETCGTDSCVDTVNDASNCGGCDVVCPGGISCQDGACACPSGGEVCAGACTDTMANGQHCGGCDQPCDAGLFCLAGACVADCGALSACGGGCVDTMTNAQHCGGCDSPCPAGASCQAGACACGAPLSYAADIEPLLAGTCTSMGCHGFPIPKEDLDLRAGAGYADLVGVTANQCNGRLRVEPGNPDDSYLVDKLLGVDLCFGTRMPKDPPPLSQAEIDMVSSWICQGAPV